MLTVNQFRGIVIEARLALLSVQLYRDGTQVLMCSRTALSTVYAPQISVDIFKLGGEYCLLVGRTAVQISLERWPSHGKPKQQLYYCSEESVCKKIIINKNCCTGFVDIKVLLLVCFG